MIVPCMVNSWLYCSSDRNCRPGRASSVRISRAMNPPMKKNANEVTRYIRPICLASVVRSSRASAEPFVGLCTGHGRVTIGLGATVVTCGLLAKQSYLARRIVPAQDPPPEGGLFGRCRRTQGEADGAGRDGGQYQEQGTPGDQPLRRGEPGQPAGHLGDAVAGRRGRRRLLGRGPVEPGLAQDGGGAAQYQ